MIQTKTYALAAVAITIAALLWWGLEILFIPPIYKLAHENNIFLYFQGHILIAAAVMLAWLRQWAAEKLIWMCQEVHRWVSTLLMFAVVGMEGFMHLLNIPHPEGWWVPIIGGGAASASALLLQRRKKKHSTSHHSDHNQ